MSVDTKKKVIAFIDDLMFRSKVNAAAKALSLDVEYIRDSAGIEESLEASRPCLMVLDLHIKSLDPLQTIKLLKSKPGLSDVPLLGYFSHVQDDLKKMAEEAGCDTVLPRSKFSADLTNILGKYV
ncbi:MAG: response regulator [Thermodesulfobacteriota bacterium]